MNPSDLNPSTAQALVIVDELIRCGVGDVVLCPGSRNAPLSFALAAAERAGRLRLHVRFDERSAAFLALGISRGLGHGPRRAGRVAITCTSGTAVANLHPALLEAAHTGEPIIALTADRPPELIGSGANQTTEHHGIFTPHIRTVNFPLAERRAGQNGMWRGMLCRVLAETATAPLHLNVPFREPLVPETVPTSTVPMETGKVPTSPQTNTADETGTSPTSSQASAPTETGKVPGWPESLEGRPNGAPWVSVYTETSPDTDGAELLAQLPQRTLVIIGEAPWRAASAAGELARRMDWPLLVEPPGVGPRHTLSSASLILNSVDDLPTQLRPDAIVLVGRPTLSRGIGKLLRSAGCPVHLVCTPTHWADAGYVANSAVPHLDPSALGKMAAAELDARTGGHWTAGWRKANARIAEVIAEWLDASVWPSGTHIAIELLRSLPSPATMFLGSSNAVRDVDLVAERRGDLVMLANRGLAGIDGAVSTAFGATLAVARLRGPEVPGYAFLGDLSFLHDVNGLHRPASEPEPNLTIVVNNDDGGGIFSLLEQGESAYADTFERAFGTPHGADIGALCAGYGVRRTLCADRASFQAAVAPGPGLRVVEVRTDRNRLRTDRAELRAAVAQAVTS